MARCTAAGRRNGTCSRSADPASASADAAAGAVMPARRLAASTGFAPVARADARVLVLGSLPGQMSLARQQYYAQPRNAFWKITGELFGFEPSLDYDARLRALVAQRVALWDTCAAAVRPGSLDARILRSSVVPNDFAPFLQAHPQIRRLCFNGATSAALFERLVLPTLAGAAAGAAAPAAAFHQPGPRRHEPGAQARSLARGPRTRSDRLTGGAAVAPLSARPRPAPRAAPRTTRPASASSAPRCPVARRSARCRWRAPRPPATGSRPAARAAR